MANASPLPAMTGGPISDGNYVLTGIIEYGTSTADSYQQRGNLSFSGNQFELITQRLPASEDDAAGTYSVSGSQLTMSFSCPSGLQVPPYPYTATANSISVRFDLSSSAVDIYTKQ